MADSPDPGVSRRGATLGVTLSALLVAAAVSGPRLRPLPERSGVDAPPFYGTWALHDVGRIVPAIVAAALLLWVWPTLTARLHGIGLAATTGLASVAWAVLVAVSGGVDRLWSPFASRYGYLDVGTELDTGAFLRTFVDRLGRYPTHVKGHPPGLPLLLRTMDSIGLGGPRWAAVLVFLAWAAGIAAVVVAVREVGGDAVARRVSGAVAFLPGVVFAASSFDAFFTGAMAIAIALLVIAASRAGWRSDVSALVGGALAAGCLHLSYGLVPLGLVPLVAMVRARRIRPVLVAAVGAVGVFAAFVLSGFWWLDGLEATRGFYADGISQFRPYSYFVFLGNPAALALALGPVVAAGIGALVAHGPRPVRTEGWGLLALAALTAVIAADLTGLSNAEVERIWLPFMPWIAVAAATVVGSRRAERWWLGSSLALGILLQVSLVTPW